MTHDRARGALLGLAIGDAMGAPTEGMSLHEIRARWGRVTGFLSDDAAGTDDTEYAVLCAQGLIAYGCAMTSDDVADHWLAAIAQQNGGFHGAGFSEMVAISNLQAGLRPPASGQRNPELWSDGAAMRVAPLGIYAAGDPQRAAELAAIDARVSHADDGVYCAQAQAAGVAVAMMSDSIDPVIEAMLAALPADSWSRRMADRAVEIGARAQSVEQAEEELFAQIPLHHYMWADVAPEALALSMGLLRACDGGLHVIESGVNIGRDSDTIAAMAGAVAGALHGAEALPRDWRDQVQTVAGRCITATAGTDLIDLADALLARAAADQENAHVDA